MTESEKSVQSWKSYGEEVNRRALMAAAAPDMLEALEYIVSWTPDNWDPEKARAMAKKAIAKAKGEK